MKKDFYYLYFKKIFIEKISRKITQVKIKLILRKNEFEIITFWIFGQIVQEVDLILINIIFFSFRYKIKIFLQKKKINLK